jgi:hypothetical protein
MQRTLEKSVQALESTALRLRRLSQPAARATPASTGEPSKAPGSRGSAEAVPSGRVAHDARGNAIWNWATEASAIALESTSRLLKKLEIPELSVDDKPQGLSLEERDPGGGYDPYNRGKGGQGKR